MSIKTWLFKDETNQEAERVARTNRVTNVSYSELLNLSRPFSFCLLKNKVADVSEWNALTQGAVDLLKKDLMRLGESFYKIDPGLRNKLIGSIGAMVLTTDNDGNATLRFHKRDADGIWDNASKIYPEKFLSDEQRAQIANTFEIFFTLEDDEEE